MTFVSRSLSPQESRVVLRMAEHGSKEIERREIIDMLRVSPRAAHHVIRSLRRKGWLEHANWGRYLLIPPEMGRALALSEIATSRRSPAGSPNPTTSARGRPRCTTVSQRSAAASFNW